MASSFPLTLSTAALPLPSSNLHRATNPSSDATAQAERVHTITADTQKRKTIAFPIAQLVLQLNLLLPITTKNATQA
jgi:hypothetical protein